MSSRALVDVWEHAPDDWDPGTRFVALTLADHMSRQTGVAFPSLGRLEALTGMGQSTIRRKLRVIEEAGWVVRESQFAASGRQTSNLWIWKGPPPNSGGSPRPDRAGGGSQIGGDGAPDLGGSIEEPLIGTSYKELPLPPPRSPQATAWHETCEHGAPHRGRLCIECRGHRIRDPVSPA